MNIIGKLSIFGTAELNPTQQTIEFVNGFSLPPITSGDFNRPWTTVTWQNSGHELSWSGLGSNSDLSCGISCLFTLGDASLSEVQLTSISYVNDILFVFGNGSMSLLGSDKTFGDWSLSSQNGAYPNEYGNWTALTFIPREVPMGPIGSGVLGALLGIGVIVCTLLQRKWLKVV